MLKEALLSDLWDATAFQLQKGLHTTRTAAPSVHHGVGWVVYPLVFRGTLFE